MSHITDDACPDCGSDSLTATHAGIELTGDIALAFLRGNSNDLIAYTVSCNDCEYSEAFSASK